MHPFFVKSLLGGFINCSDKMYQVAHLLWHLSVPTCKSLLKVRVKARTTQVGIHLPFFSLFKSNIFFKSSKCKAPRFKTFGLPYEVTSGKFHSWPCDRLQSKSRHTKKILSKITCRLYITGVWNKQILCFLLGVSNSKKKIKPKILCF